jgi:hypothetical protein
VNKFHHCAACNTVNASILEEVSLLVCKNCHEIVFENAVENHGKSKRAKVPEDWSFLQIGSQVEYNKKPISIVGRLRLQLRNDYKNFWCATLNEGKHIWIMESFASFCILGATWHTFEGQIGQLLLAGATITLNEELTIKGEYVEKCLNMSYEGEVGTWKLFNSGFQLIQCSNNNNNTAIFFVNGRSNNIQYLSGGKVNSELLNLKNILTWDEWK